ncbi:RAD50-interacting protein 1-like [Coccinella septempunctata]|uniref:RAD50-interacting protein 1-like n=1 Tax=Coccinella septempunctata TaxID=41139 RepID=UPI001D05D6CE|nr:RAD50-interacting protein 1-like [Coccinella septempunctata]XP_044757277.1 RAD50-interacting protein 1-like [Coccinella septempunctata]
MMNNIKIKSFENLQLNFGNDLLDSKKCKLIYHSLIQKKQSLLSKLNVRNIDCPIEVTELIENDLDGIYGTRRKYEDLLHKVNVLQITKQYIRVIQKLEYFNVELEREYKSKDYEKCVTIFANLCEINWNLKYLDNFYLNNIICGVQKYWHDILKSSLSESFEETLKSIKWPFVNANFSLQTPPQNAIDGLKLLTEYLLQIELSNDPFDSIALSMSTSCLSAPTFLMIQPLRKRFIYHFYGPRQTNRLDKPEWYFTQILTWIRDHKEFLHKWIQPVVDKLGYCHLDIELEFMVGLVQLAVEKLHADIGKAQYDDFTFSHTVDEALSFDKELRISYDYPVIQAGVLGVLTQAQVFIKWISMERKFALEKMDNILSSSELAFEPLDSDIDNLKVTVCADAFMTLLKRITDRYESLPQPGHRLQFLELQLELLDDFRVRLIQIAKAEEGNVIESKVPMIANTLFYMENVLLDWGNTLHHLNLYYYKSKSENISPTVLLPDIDDSTLENEAQSVFTETLLLYGDMRRFLISTMSEFVMEEIESKSQNYIREDWSKMKVDKDFKNLSLTPSACSMFEVIAKRLHQLQKSLADKIFSIIWKSLAQQLDNYLFEELIWNKKLEKGGILQLRYDIERNLFPLFSQFTDKPEGHFKQLLGSLQTCNI